MGVRMMWLVIIGTITITLVSMIWGMVDMFGLIYVVLYSLGIMVVLSWCTYQISNVVTRRSEATQKKNESMVIHNTPTIDEKFMELYFYYFTKHKSCRDDIAGGLRIILNETLSRYQIETVNYVLRTRWTEFENAMLMRDNETIDYLTTIMLFDATIFTLKSFSSKHNDNDHEWIYRINHRFKHSSGVKK